MEEKLKNTDAGPYAASPSERRLKKRLAVSIALTGIIFFVELVGGYLTSSLALMTDAAHVFMDVFALGLTLSAIYISELAPTEKRTYGLHRVEVFVAFVNSFTLLIVTLFVFYSAYKRILHPIEVEGLGMFIIAVVGLVVNLIVAMWLAPLSSTDMNIKSAFLHVAGDAAASVGVIIAAVIIYFTGWSTVDPLISISICVVLLFGIARILRDSSNILLEGVPPDVDIAKVVLDMTGTQGVDSVHDLHIWSICHNVYAMSAHIDIIKDERWRMGEIYKELNENLARDHHIFYTTLQAECIGCTSPGLFGSVSHRGNEHGHGHLH
ncbi:MAG: cation diffusion facilitator family transporter [Thermodesulfobacteriota bacterium]